MKLFIDDIELRPDEVEKDVEINFDEITCNGQKRILQMDKDRFIEEALISQYIQVRNFAIDLLKEKGNFSKETLKQAIPVFLNLEYELLAIINSPDFCPDEADLDYLAFSKFSEIKMWLARNPKTPLKVLKKILKEEYSSEEITKEVFSNPNFELDDEIKEYISENEEEKMIQIDEV